MSGLAGWIALGLCISTVVGLGVWIWRKGETYSLHREPGGMFDQDIEPDVIEQSSVLRVVGRLEWQRAYDASGAEYERIDGSVKTPDGLVCVNGIRTGAVTEVVMRAAYGGTMLAETYPQRLTSLAITRRASALMGRVIAASKVASAKPTKTTKATKRRAAA